MKYRKNEILAGVLILFLSLTVVSKTAEASCSDCIEHYKTCLANSLFPGMPNVPFNWFTGGPARCVANRNSCLKGCGYKACKKSCRDVKRAEIEFCDRQFAETRCAISDKKCKKKARRLRKQCKKDARSQKRSCVKSCKTQMRNDDTSLQGRLFNVRVVKVETNGMVTFELIRNQRGSNCNKIKMIRITSSGESFPDYYLSQPRCSFSQTLKVQVFKPVSCDQRQEQEVRFQLFTVKNPERTGPWQEWNNRGEQTVSVTTDSLCALKGRGMKGGDIHKLPISKPYDMGGWWKMQSTYASPAVNGLWRFSLVGGGNSLESNFSTAGVAGPTGVMTRNGRGNATMNTGNNFVWKFSWSSHGAKSSMECKGVLKPNARPVRVVGKCYPFRGISLGANPLGTFSLTRSNLVRTKGEPLVNRPQGFGGSPVPPQPKPRSPGGGFKPGPGLPKPVPRW